jgi:hypothetical protein
MEPINQGVADLLSGMYGPPLRFIISYSGYRNVYWRMASME